MKKKIYVQKVLVGKNRRPAQLITQGVLGETQKFSVVVKGKVIATRTTSARRNAPLAIASLAKACKGLAYVYVIPVDYSKSAKEILRDTFN